MILAYFISLLNFLSYLFSFIKLNKLEPSKSDANLKLSLEVLKYENSVLRRELEQQKCAIDELKSSKSTETIRRVKMDENADIISSTCVDRQIHQIIKQKYYECESYKRQLEVLNGKIRNAPRYRRLIPVLDTCNSSKVDLNGSMPEWTPMASDEFLSDAEPHFLQLDCTS